MTDNIVAKVAAVLDDTTLVLNGGSLLGIKEGMFFDIVAQHQQISDPDTGESLGQWEQAKARVVVTHVQERMSTVRAPLAAESESSGTLSALLVRHSFGLYGDREDLRNGLDVRVGNPGGRPAIKRIEVGDLARMVEFDAAAAVAVEAAGPADRPTKALPSATYDSYLRESGPSQSSGADSNPSDDPPGADQGSK
jgi:hypothetical protein